MTLKFFFIRSSFFLFEMESFGHRLLNPAVSSCVPRFWLFGFDVFERDIFKFLFFFPCLDFSAQASYLSVHFVLFPPKSPPPFVMPDAPNCCSPTWPGPDIRPRATLELRPRLLAFVLRRSPYGRIPSRRLSLTPFRSSIYLLKTRFRGLPPHPTPTPPHPTVTPFPSHPLTSLSSLSFTL